MLQPVLVREVGDERFELIAGERRWRAAKRAGLPSIPVVVREVDEVLVARAGAGREPPPRGPQPARGGRRLPAADGGLRAHPGGGGPEGRASRARRWPTRCGCSSSRPPSSGSSPRTSSAAATPGRCSAPPTGRSRRRWPSRSWPRGCRCGRPRRRCGATTRRSTRADEAGRAEPPRRRRRRPPSGCAPRACSSSRSCWPSHLDTRVKVTMAGSDGKGKVVVEFGGLEDLERIYRAMTDGRAERLIGRHNARDPRRHRRGSRGSTQG